MKPNTFRTSVAHDTDQGLVIETRQDISDILEANLAERNLKDKHTRWGDDLFDNKIASIAQPVLWIGGLVIAAGAVWQTWIKK